MGIILFGAFDRYNYGDFLFPLILTKAIHDRNGQQELFYAGQIFSDFSSLGGFRVKPLNYLKELLGENVDIIHVGGEILTCSSKFMMFMNLPQPYASTMAKMFADTFWEQVFASGTKSPFGYVDEPAVGRRRIHFNSVGGSSLSHLSLEMRESLRRVFKSSTYLSVRDESTRAQVKELLGVEAKCAPDCAVLMKKYFDVETAELVQTVGGLFLQEKEYFCFQANMSVVSTDINKIVEELSQISKTFNKKIVLVPIGTAAFHEDDVALDVVGERLRDRGVEVGICGDRNIFIIMRVIRHSAAMICTSLHGRITALAFEVPRITIFSGDSKQESYIRTWESEVESISIVRDFGILEALKNVMAVPSLIYKEIALRNIRESEVSVGVLIDGLECLGVKSSKVEYGVEQLQYNRKFTSQLIQELGDRNLDNWHSIVSTVDALSNKVESLNVAIQGAQDQIEIMHEEMRSDYFGKTVVRFFSKVITAVRRRIIKN